MQKGIETKMGASAGVTSQALTGFEPEWGFYKPQATFSPINANLLYNVP